MVVPTDNFHDTQNYPSDRNLHCCGYAFNETVHPSPVWGVLPGRYKQPGDTLGYPANCCPNVARPLGFEFLEHSRHRFDRAAQQHSLPQMPVTTAVVSVACLKFSPRRRRGLSVRLHRGHVLLSVHTLQRRQPSVEKQRFFLPLVWGSERPEFSIDTIAKHVTRVA